MFALLLLQAAASPDPATARAVSVIEQQKATRADYNACMKRETLRLGAGNQESPTVIVQAASSVCRDRETSMLATLQIMGLESEIKRVTELWRKQAADDATLALIEARNAGKKITPPKRGRVSDGGGAISSSIREWRLPAQPGRRNPSTTVHISAYPAARPPVIPVSSSRDR